MFGGPEVSYHQTYSARDWLSILRTPYPTQNLQRKHRTDSFGASSCNSEDETDQRVQSLMFMMMIIIIIIIPRICLLGLDESMKALRTAGARAEIWTHNHKNTTFLKLCLKLILIRFWPDAEAHSGSVFSPHSDGWVDSPLLGADNYFVRAVVLFFFFSPFMSVLQPSAWLEREVPCRTQVCQMGLTRCK